MFAVEFVRLQLRNLSLALASVESLIGKGFVTIFRKVVVTEVVRFWEVIHEAFFLSLRVRWDV